MTDEIIGNVYATIRPGKQRSDEISDGIFDGKRCKQREVSQSKYHHRQKGNEYCKKTWKYINQQSFESGF